QATVEEDDGERQRADEIGGAVVAEGNAADAVLTRQHADAEEDEQQRRAEARSDEARGDADHDEARAEKKQRIENDDAGHASFGAGAIAAARSGSRRPAEEVVLHEVEPESGECRIARSYDSGECRNSGKSRRNGNGDCIVPRVLPLCRTPVSPITHKGNRPLIRHIYSLVETLPCSGRACGLRTRANGETWRSTNGMTGSPCPARRAEHGVAPSMTDSICACRRRTGPPVLPPARSAAWL